MWFVERDKIVKKVLVVFAGISASVFGVNIPDAALTSGNPSKSIDLRNIKNYNDYYIATSSRNEKWGDCISDEDDQWLEELYEVCLHLSNLELEKDNSFGEQKENGQKYSHWIRAIESKDVSSLKNQVINSKDNEKPLLILLKYGLTKLDQKDLFNLTQALLSDKKVKKKIKLNAKNEEGDTPLSFVAKNNNEEIFKLLVNNGANADEALNVLIQNDQNNLVKWLIDQKSLKKIKLNVNKKNTNGDTPLLIAAQKGNEEIFNLLIGNGANVTARNKDGQTAREIAVSKGFKNYIEKEPDKKNGGKKTKNSIDATIIVTKGDKDFAKQRAVLEKKLFERIKRNKVDTPLFDAIGIGSEKIVKYLVEKCKLDVNEEGWAGSPLHCAVALCHENIVKYLVERGADINKKNKQKDTALHIATELGNQKLVKLLIENGANVDAENDEGKTSLMIASLKGNENIVKYLLEHGAEINHENARKESAAIFASVHGHENILKFLLKNGGRR